MTKDEALKLALEALEYHTAQTRPIEQTNEAITAIKEALAQPEQERFLIATIGNWGRVEWADGVFPSLGDKMYSAPRTWVGLTDEEVITMSRYDLEYAALIGEVQRKLKEKNT